MTGFRQLFRACLGKAPLGEGRSHGSGPRRPEEAPRPKTDEKYLAQPPSRCMCTAREDAHQNTNLQNPALGDAIRGTVAAGTTNGTGEGASALRSRVNASRLHDMDAENVVVCDALQAIAGLRLKQHELGRGSYGLVVTGKST
jgi:hypothetical protein